MLFGIEIDDAWPWWLVATVLLLAWVRYCLSRRPDPNGKDYLSFGMCGWVVFAVLALPAAVLWVLTAEIVGGWDRARGHGSAR